MRRFTGLVLLPLSIAAVLMLFCSLAQADHLQFLESYADPQNPKHIFALFDSVSPGGTYLLHSKDGGKTWKKIPEPIGDGYINIHGREKPFGDFFIRVGPQERPRLVITYWAGSLWRASSDLRWQKYSAPAPDKDIVRFIPTNHPDKFFAIVGEFSSDEGALFWTDTGGASWQKVNDKVPYSCPFHSCNGFASTDGRVLILGSILLPLIVESGKSGGYISRDGGKTWNSLLRNQLENELKSLEPTARRQMPIKETPDQIDAAMRGIKAEEIRTQEEFERARKR